jgi:hypothetical protein
VLEELGLRVRIDNDPAPESAPERIVKAGRIKVSRSRASHAEETLPAAIDRILDESGKDGLTSTQIAAQLTLEGRSFGGTTRAVQHVSGTLLRPRSVPRWVSDEQRPRRWRRPTGGGST